MRIRIRETGDVVNDNEFRLMHPDTSFPVVLTEGILSDFGADPVLEGPQPTLTQNQYAKYDGVEQINGKWFTKYIAVDYSSEQINSMLESWREGAFVSPFQGRTALRHANIYDQVVSLMNNPNTPDKDKDAWEYALEWRRKSDLVVNLASQLNLTDEQVDDLFKYGMSVTA